MNILGIVDCSDMEQSEYDPRSERYAREFTKLVIDPEKARGVNMFRLAERPTLVIVDDQVKQCLETSGVKGIRADPLELSQP